jgi:uncharacterized membrane protein YqjE
MRRTCIELHGLNLKEDKLHTLQHLWMVVVIIIIIIIVIIIIIKSDE